MGPGGTLSSREGILLKKTTTIHASCILAPTQSMFATEITPTPLSPCQTQEGAVGEPQLIATRGRRGRLGGWGALVGFVEVPAGESLALYSWKAGRASRIARRYTRACKGASTVSAHSNPKTTIIMHNKGLGRLVSAQAVSMGTRRQGVRRCREPSRRDRSQQRIVRRTSESIFNVIMQPDDQDAAEAEDREAH